jgi:SAM-dependent methyltransferase
MNRRIKRLVGGAFFGTARVLSKTGEAIGCEWLIYNPLVHIGFERSARRHASPFADTVLAAFPDAQSIADIGCGTGRFAAEFLSRQKRIVACEYSARLRRKTARRGVEVYPFDLSNPSQQPLTGAPFDVAYCLEVAEHIPDSMSDALVQFIATHGKAIVFTAAQPGQGGTGHINEQPKSYWQAKFERRGCDYDSVRSDQIARRLRSANTEAFMYENVMVFSCKGG